MNVQPPSRITFNPLEADRFLSLEEQLLINALDSKGWAHYDYFGVLDLTRCNKYRY